MSWVDKWIGSMRGFFFFIGHNNCCVPFYVCFGCDLVISYINIVAAMLSFFLVFLAR